MSFKIIFFGSASALPIEETADFIHFRILEPDQFETCRITDLQGRLPRGIRAKYCKYKGRDQWATQAYIFTKADGWTREKAVDWAEKHKASLIPFSYFAAFKLEERNGKRYAQIYVIDSSVNRNKWQVTPKARAKALETLLNAPLLGPPELGHKATKKVGRFVDFLSNSYTAGLAEITDDEAWEKMESGEWTAISPQIIAYDITEQNGIEVIDDFVFDHVVFVEKAAYPRAQVKELCEGTEESCGFSRMLTAALDFHGHVGHDDVASSRPQGTQDAEKNSFIDSKEVDHMDSKEDLQKFFGGVLPYQESRKAPEDEEWDFNSSEYDVDQLKRACAWFDSENPDVKGSYKLGHHRPDGTVVWRGVSAAMAALMGARGGVDIPAEDKRGVYNHLSKHYADFGKEPPEFSASKEGVCPKLNTEEKIKELETKLADSDKIVKTLTAEKQDLEKKLAEFSKDKDKPFEKLDAQLKELSAENKELKGKLAKIEEEKHMVLVGEVLDLREKAGLVKDRGQEVEGLKKLSAEVLNGMKTDLAAIIERMETSLGPRAKYTAEHANKTIENIREQLFGFRRDANGKKVGGA